MSSLQTLLTDILDYAGLYPPAGLPLPEVVSNYSGYLQHPAAWMLARLIIPVQRLDEFAELARTSWTLAAPETLPWRISCLVPGPEGDQSVFAEAWRSISAFNARHSGRAVIDAVESKVDDVAQLAAAARHCESSVATYWELPHAKSCRELLGVIAQLGSGHRGKIRTGGIQPQLIAAVDDVARFLHECALAKVAFKATAGLHHPLRAEYPLTYAADSPCATMHGFLNVFVAAAAAWRKGAGIEQIADLLTTSQSGNFRFGPDSLEVGGLRFSREDLAATRRQFAIGFGSCSFSEPIEDLRALGWLDWETLTIHS
ncbi:MAG: hypothetical protein ACK493_08230 [Planctomycetota bacterium]|jgi:hypothetical protein|nr:hypothetical protein [Blastopirellula sp.]